MRLASPSPYEPWSTPTTSDPSSPAQTGNPSSPAPTAHPAPAASRVAVSTHQTDSGGWGQLWSRTGPAFRRTIARHRWLPWVAVMACAAATAAVVGATLRELDDERTRWSTGVDVWVAGEPTAPGAPITARRATLPAPMVPNSAVDTDPTQSVARRHIDVGEVVVARDLAAVDGVLALAAPDEWVIAIHEPVMAAAVSGSPPIGQRAAVVADGVALTDSARLVGVDGDGVVLLGVPPDVAPAVAAAARSGNAALALVP